MLKKTFDKLEYVKSETNLKQDSLILTIAGTDGNGDLGLSNDDILYPYNPYNAVIDENLNWVTLGSNNVVPPLYIYKPNGSYELLTVNDSIQTFN